MKDALLVTRRLGIFMLIMLTLLTQFGMHFNTRTWQTSSFIEIINIQSVLIGIVAMTYLGVYVYNTWSIKRIRL
jgi:hypothetical protein